MHDSCLPAGFSTSSWFALRAENILSHHCTIAKFNGAVCASFLCMSMNTNVEKHECGQILPNVGQLYVQNKVVKTMTYFKRVPKWVALFRAW